MDNHQLMRREAIAELLKRMTQVLNNEYMNEGQTVADILESPQLALTFEGNTIVVARNVYGRTQRHYWMVSVATGPFEGVVDVAELPRVASINDCRDAATRVLNTWEQM